MNTIKTKIGFEIKPYDISTIYFKELFNISTQIYGQVLLVVAIVLSAGSWMYLRSINQEKISQLQALQQEAVQLKRYYKQLALEYEALSSKERLKSLISEIDMQEPTVKETIRLSKGTRD